MNGIKWSSILNDRQYIGFRITMSGVTIVFIGFIGFVIAIFGFMDLGVSVFVVGLSTAVTGILVNVSHVNRRKER